MALNNLLSVMFTEAELAQMDQALTIFEAVLVGKTIHLTPDQRQQHGRIAEQNKLFVNKAKGIMEQYPQHVPVFIDKPEFDRDFIARAQLEARYQRMSSILEQLSDTKTLLDHDNYHNAITFYRNIKYLSGENVPGTTFLYEDMRQFFVNPSTGIVTEPKANKENNDNEKEE
ncbi:MULTISPECIES: hypothetical protein [unclassified Chryseobacterium]|uniref:hypothetical protein n=1 Tax=unclassified Chryseobacterium TaxID=2593645 RepID=UPI000A4BCC8B|nr:MULTISPECIES: hypothetical protein [unclassified Chryseobacterium]